MPQDYSYSIYKLKFNTPVRFGDGRGATGLNLCSMTASSDTLFSALFSEVLRLYGEDSIKSWFDQFNEEKIKISGLMPYKEDELYLPKPLLLGTGGNKSGRNIKKELKKLNYIPLSGFEKYLEFLKTGIGDIEAFSETFGEKIVYDKANLRDNENPELYQVSTWCFLDNCGLYFIAAAYDPEIFEELWEITNSLGKSGVGGKISSGLGKFSVSRLPLDKNEKGRKLSALLQDDTAPVQMLLGLLAPACQDEIAVLKDERSRYLLVERSGFIASLDYRNEQGQSLKRKSSVLVKEGSCLTERLSGCILDLSWLNVHPVWRLGKTLYVGLRV